jgi:hypothetical protein
VPISEGLIDSSKLVALTILVTIVFKIRPKIRVQKKYTTMLQMVAISYMLELPKYDIFCKAFVKMMTIKATMCIIIVTLFASMVFREPTSLIILQMPQIKTMQDKASETYSKSNAIFIAF